MITLLLLLIAGHYLCDFAFQSDAMAQGKNRHHKIDPSKIPPGATPQTIWPHWLTAHAAIHAGVVGLATGMPLLGIAEFAVHWVTDFGKSENWFGIHTDQAIHLVSKGAWVLLCLI